MTQAAKVQEPTMEEILASIRRIIADDDAKPPAAAPPPAPTPPSVSTPPRQAAPPPPPPPVAPTPLPIAEPKALKQDGIDLMLAELDERVEPTTLGGGPPDVLDLTESMVAPAPPQTAPEDANFRTIDGEPDVIFRETEPEPLPPPAAKAIPEARRPAQQFAPERPLLSNATTAAVDSAFNTLAHTVLVQNACTLEDLVREMLRPMLKNWLDDNLPNIVERMVKAEIERVSRGRG